LYFINLFFMTNLSKNKNPDNFSAYLSIWVSIIGNIILFAFKIWAGIVSKSVAVIADAWHTLSDSISSIIVFIGIKISEKRPTKQFPFGFGRADTLASGILAILLTVISIEFLIKGAEKLISRETATYTAIVYWAMGLTIVLKEIMAQISTWGAKKSGKKSLSADAWHHRSDAISSLVIIIGVIFSKKFWWIDGVLGVLVAIIIAYTAFEIMKDVFKAIIGESPSPELMELIKETVTKTAGMEIYPHHFHIHQYGQHIELTMHIYLSPNIEIIAAHTLTDEIEKDLYEKLNLTTTIHVEPLPENIKLI